MRAYAPIVDRQQRTDRLVFNEADFRSVLGAALTEGTVSTIRLGANIILTSSVVLNGAYEVVVDGGNRYALTVDANRTLTEFFTVASGVTVQGLMFRGVTFTAGPDLIVRCADATVTLSRVNFQDVYAEMIHDFVLGDSGNPTWADSVIEGVTFLAERSGSIITPGLGTVVLKRCHLSRCAAYLASGDPFAVHVTNSSGSDGNVYLGVTAASALGASDVYLASTSAEENVLSRPLVVGAYPATASSIAFSTAQSFNGGTQWTMQASGTTSGAVSATLAQFTPSPSKSYLITARYVGRRTNGADPGPTNTYIQSQQFKVSSGGAVTTGGLLENLAVTDDATWNAALDTATGNIRFRVAGAAAINITWSVTATIDEL